MKTAGDDAAVAHHGRRFGTDGQCQPFGDRRLRRQGIVQHGQQCGRLTAGQLRPQRRQAQQAFAQAGEVARAGTAQGDAGGNALDIGHAVQRGVQFAAGRLQGSYRIQPCTDGGRITQRVVQPLAQQAAAHAGRTAVQQ